MYRLDIFVINPSSIFAIVVLYVCVCCCTRQRKLSGIIFDMLLLGAGELKTANNFDPTTFAAVQESASRNSIL